MTDLNTLSDEAVVQKVIEDDHELYGILVKRYQKKLLRYAGYYCRDADQAADIVQDSFIKAYQNLNSFDQKKQFSSWIYRIVHNEALNQIKKDRRHLFGDLKNELLELFQSGDDPEADYIQKNSVKNVNRCLTKLPLRYQSVIRLFYLEDKSYEDIADILEIPLGTVGTRLNRGREALKNICREEKGAGHGKT